MENIDLNSLFWLETDGRDKSIDGKRGSKKEGRGKGGSCWWSWYGVDLTWKSSHQNGFGKHICFLETETVYHTPPPLPALSLFYVFLFVCFCFYCFSKQEMMLLFGACMYQLNIPSSHHPSYIIIITSKTSASKRKRERSVDAWRFWRVMLGFWDATGFTSNHPLNLHLSTSPLSFLRFLFFSFLFFPFLFLSFLVVKSSVTVVTIRSQKIPPPSSPVSAMMVTSFSWALQFQLDVIASLNKKKKSINIKNIYIFVPNWHSSWGKLNSTALWVFNYFIFRSM